MTRRALALLLLISGCATAPIAPRRAVLPYGTFHNDSGMLVCPACGRGDYTCTLVQKDLHADAPHLDYRCTCGQEWSTAPLAIVPTYAQLSDWLAGQQQAVALKQHDDQVRAEARAQAIAELTATPTGSAQPAPRNKAVPKQIIKATIPRAPVVSSTAHRP